MLVTSPAMAVLDGGKHLIMPGLRRSGGGGGGEGGGGGGERGRRSGGAKKVIQEEKKMNKQKKKKKKEKNFLPSFLLSLRSLPPSFLPSFFPSFLPPQHTVMVACYPSNLHAHSRQRSLTSPSLSHSLSLSLSLSFSVDGEESSPLLSCASHFRLDSVVYRKQPREGQQVCSCLYLLLLLLLLLLLVMSRWAKRQRKSNLEKHGITCRSRLRRSIEAGQGQGQGQGGEGRLHGGGNTG